MGEYLESKFSKQDMLGLLSFSLSLHIYIERENRTDNCSRSDSLRTLNNVRQLYQPGGKVSKINVIDNLLLKLHLHERK